jgi:hypothetical protein
MGKMKKQSPRK